MFINLDGLFFSSIWRRRLSDNMSFKVYNAVKYSLAPAVIRCALHVRDTRAETSIKAFHLTLKC